MVHFITFIFTVTCSPSEKITCEFAFARNKIKIRSLANVSSLPAVLESSVGCNALWCFDVCPTFFSHRVFRGRMKANPSPRIFFASILIVTARLLADLSVSAFGAVGSCDGHGYLFFAAITKIRGKERRYLPHPSHRVFHRLRGEPVRPATQQRVAQNRGKKVIRFGPHWNLPA